MKKPKPFTAKQLTGHVSRLRDIVHAKDQKIDELEHQAESGRAELARLNLFVKMAGDALTEQRATIAVLTKALATKLAAPVS